MTYNEALNFILKKQSLGIKPGLDRMKALLHKMGNPQNRMKVIHVAGTNGKGTVASTIADALMRQGKRVGLFTSPWVTDYREQLQINGAFIPKDVFAAYVEKYADSDCTEFELLTALMYQYFSDENVDYAVVECGMGGMGDATNVEKENLSVITSVSLDHTDFLGNTIEAIAEEKSGILRENGICVLYNDELEYIFKNKCKKLVTGNIKSNLDLVNAVLKVLGFSPVDELVKLPARLERINGILLDGGHNVEAAKKLAPLLHKETAVIGMMKDKDVEGYLSVIAPKCKTIIVTAPDNFRSMPVSELADIACDYCDNVLVVDSPKDAIKYKNISLICGSFYLAREVRNLL